MGLNLNGSTQWLEALWSPTAVQPMSFMAWVSRTNTSEHSLVCAGNQNANLEFNNIQCRSGDSRAISFIDYAEAQGASIPINTTQMVIGVFDGSELRVYVGNNTVVIQAWSPYGSSPIDMLRIGQVVSNGVSSPLNGTIEHAAVWSVALSGTDVAGLFDQTTAPDDIAGLVSWLPLKTDLIDSVGTLTWTPVDLASPTYTDLGVEYGVTEFTMEYNGNSNTGGTAPVDGSSPYASGSEVAVLGNTGSLVRTDYTWTGWNTEANGSGIHYDPADTFNISGNTVLYAEWEAVYQYRTINHLNYDPELKSNAEIAAAALKKVYFEHASTGMDIVGDSDIDSSTGNNYDSSGDCGLALLYAENNRYLCGRDNHSSGNDYTWFGSNTGLQDNNRGNPTPSSKVSGFIGMSADMRGAIDIAMWKYCWIDVWPSTTGYISDGAAAAASDIADIEAFESANPDITVVWWTMPLQSNESYAARQDYNDIIRTYCLDNGKWLLDIAAIESHNDAGEIQLDGNSREIAESTYMRVDGGHLDTSGRLKMGKAYWSLITAIANNAGSAVYQLSDITYDKNGDVLPACQVSVFKHNGSGAYSYVGTTESDNVTGEFAIETPDGDVAYMIVAHKDGTPNVFDVTDNNLAPELVT